ncbi:hypothetical protein Q1695_009244 [Nippostrongylus brasiliensis]|nr:hypothetical protein Q1695_009244 [Nippostrongylus brasiliensis]
MDRAKKKFASAIDGLRSFANRLEVSVDEKVQPEHCCLSKVVRHGLPDDARCLAYDPVQRLLAIGTGHGIVRIIGDVGVDFMLKHDIDHPVNHIQFSVNEGYLVTACGNDIIHLWNYRQKKPEIVNSLQLNKEGVSCIYLPLNSKWLYVGTDKGNVYFVSIATFQLSPYIINWNKAIDLSCRVHPGSVRQIGVSPFEPVKLLIAFDKGVVVQWNLATKEVDRFPLDPPIKCFSWHYEGKLVMTGNVDGSVSVFNMKKTSEPQQKSCPHGQGPCRPIPAIDWKHTPDGDQLVIFSGGMPTEDGLPVPALTFLRASKSATVLEMDHPILSFVTIPHVPYNTCPQQPLALAVLLKGELMMIDLVSPGYPCIESPHAMDLHEAPITCLAYYSDCPSDLIGALTLVGCKQRRKGYSEKPWPISGGIGRGCATGYQELVITGHKDGSVRFWQASGENLQFLYRLKTASHFERLEELEGCERVSHAVKSIELCVESRLLLVCGVSGQVTLFRFTKTESMNTIAVVQIPQPSAPSSGGTGDDRSAVPQPPKEIRRQRKVISRDSTHSPDTSDASGDECIVPFKVRGAPVKRSAGYQPELACMVPWPSTSQSDSVTTCALNSAFGVIALGLSNGLALIDIAQCALIYAWSTAELYGSDPTPAIQLQVTDMPSPSPVELEHRDADETEAPIPPPRRNKSLLSPHSSGTKVVSVVRRNTAEFAASIRDRYHDKGQPDRPQVVQDTIVVEVISPSRAGRCHSERPSSAASVGIMRRLTQKGHAVARSLSFHSHVSEGDTPRDSPLFGRNRDGAGPSPSVSNHSLDKLNLNGQEFVSSISFIHSYSRRNDQRTAPCLWVGTSAGTSIALHLILPQDRLISTVVVAPSGTIVKLRGQVLYQTFMDQSLCLSAGANESYKETSKDSKDSGSPEKNINNRVLTKPSLSPSYSSSVEISEEIPQILIAAAEYEVKVIALPSFSQLFAYKCEDIPLVKAEATHVRGFPVLMCLAADGKIVVLSLPSLRLLHQSPLLPHSVEIDDPICQKMSFSEHGLGIYMTSPSEVEKYTICSELADQAADAVGELYVACDLPEPPRNNSSFLKGVSSMFTGTPRQDSCDVDAILADREKTSGGIGGGATRIVARTIPGPSVNMDRAHAGGVSAGQAAMQALQNISERGEKLSATVDATENLRNNAMNLSQRTGKLVEKMEKKKWYNF